MLLKFNSMPDFRSVFPIGLGLTNNCARREHGLPPAPIVDFLEKTSTRLKTIYSTALSAYQPVELTPAEIAKRGSLLYLFTDLIYVEYKDGVRDGVVSVVFNVREKIVVRQSSDCRHGRKTEAT